MPVSPVRLNHAVLFVADLDRAERFYTKVFGMVVAAREPRANAAFLRLPRSGNHHDLGLFAVGTAAPKRSAADSSGFATRGSRTGAVMLQFLARRPVPPRSEDGQVRGTDFTVAHRAADALQLCGALAQRLLSTRCGWWTTSG
jgi:catechol 2,3-dioxygenase-like lactoylglutathione lyase family enzyme